jgi:ubiquinone/menaquinone biosynthesis C-methylase UbiE
VSDPQGLRFVEPLAGMRVLLERLVPEAESLDGTAEAIPLPDASVDAAFVAEAFHWFDAAAAALPEAERQALATGLREAIAEGEYRVEIDTHVYEARRL